MKPDTAVIKGVNKPQSKMKIILILATAVIILVSAFIFYRWRMPAAIVCGPEVVKRYNEASVKTGSDYDDGIKAVAQDVTAQSGYEDDPTCVFIAFQHYVNTEDVDKARPMLEQLKELESKELRVDEDVINYQSTQQMEVYLKGLEHNKTLGDDLDGAG